MLLSLAWVSCKDAGTSTETTNTEAVADSAFIANKNSAMQNLSGLREGVQAKITELETGMATADDAAKAVMTTELDTYKKFLADLDAVSAKVNDATQESWSAVSTEVEAVHYAVKSTLTGMKEDGTTDQISQ